MSNETQHQRRVHVMQVVGDPVGGIRKHVHSILMNMDYTQFQQSYVFSSVSCDSKFREDITRLKECLNDGIIPLIIKKKPNVIDIVNIVKLVLYVKKNHVDILHGHGAKGGLYARIVAKICGIKSIYTPHGGVVHNMFSFFQDKIYTVVEKYLYSMTNYFVFESQYTSDAYQAKFGITTGRSMVNYSGVAPVRIDEVKAKSAVLGYTRTSHSELHIGVFGMLRSQKGQIYAVQAVYELINQGHNIYLHLFGDGPDRDQLMWSACHFNISKNVIFHGDVDDVEVHMYAMDLIVVPSIFESFGYVAVEAISLGKFVIASNVGGLKEIIINGENGILITEKNSMELARAIRGFQINFKKKMQKNISKKFEINVMIRNLSNLYKNFAKNGM